ncbi:MAG TPA: endonuclease/exonuclease/phosphatase family protein [Gaiellaceae bacterium]|nr:endonuclease/exonuclease/phosphatase family protein [Gaiellaceae bacterium]
MPLLVRTWNVFHGNAVPPERDAFLEQMIRLAAGDDPDVVCLQELPVWALARLETWSGMAVVAAPAQRPGLGPLPWPAEAGRAVTDLHHGLLRSALTGQANAVLVARRHRPIGEDSLVLNPPAFRRAQARSLGLDLVARLAWAKERRVCQAVRIELADGGTLALANLHATSYGADDRLADAELHRAAVFLETFARSGEPVVLAGDTNVEPGRSATLEQLAAEGFSTPAPGIDQILARGLRASAPETWPVERRTVDGRVLSDHAPVEVTLG